MTSKIKIGHHEYEIESGHDLTVEENGQIIKVFGKCNTDEKRIVVDVSVGSHEFRKEILIHEILHGLFQEASIELDYDHEEETITALGKTMHGFLKDNIDYLSDLYRKDEEETVTAYAYADGEQFLDAKENPRFIHDDDIHSQIKKNIEGIEKG